MEDNDRGNREYRDYCPTHALIQEERTERYAAISSSLEALEGKIADLDRRNVSRDYFRIVLAISVVIFGYLFLTLGAVQREYVHKTDWYEWKVERERRLNEVKESFEIMLNAKEDRHLGIHDNGKDNH